MIDVIIPTYNNRKTLGRTLASLAAQTYTNFKVRIIDDGSTEDISDIINNFKSYLNIRYKKLEYNTKSPGLVRQAGIDASNAEYVVFLDADDILLPQGLQIFNKYIEEKHPDIIVSQFLIQTQDNQYKTCPANHSTWVHGKAYRRSFLETKHIKFCEGYNEDGQFNTTCNMLTENILHVKDFTMIWMHNPNSITRSSPQWIIANADCNITSLETAYLTIFKEYNYNIPVRVIVNLGKHIGMFYNYYEALKFHDAPEASESFLNTFKHFAEALNLPEQDWIHSKVFKYGIYEGKKTMRVFEPYIESDQVQDFLAAAGINISFTLSDLTVTSTEEKKG